MSLLLAVRRMISEWTVSSMDSVKMHEYRHEYCRCIAMALGEWTGSKARYVEISIEREQEAARNHLNGRSSY